MHSLLQECYLDQIATEQLTLIYNGGCRAKDVRTHGNRCVCVCVCVCVFADCVKRGRK